MFYPVNNLVAMENPLDETATKICRTCLNANGTVGLFSVCEDFDGHTLADLLKICCDIQITDNIKSQSKIKTMCDECVTTLLIMFKFRDKAQEAQRILALQELEMSSSVDVAACIDSHASSCFDSVLPTPSSCMTDTDDAMFNLNESIDIATVALFENYNPMADLEESAGGTSTTSTGLSTPASSRCTADAASTNSADNSGDDEIINYVLPIIKPKNSVLEDKEPQAVRLKRKGRRSVKETPINYKCKQCGAGFFILKNLVNHLVQQHAIQERYSCHLCTECFTNVDAYMEHKKSHEETLMALESIIPSEKGSPPGKPVTKTEPKKIYKCTHCPKSFVSKSSLDAHIRVHTGERPFQCKQCDKHFKTQGALELHERRHAGIKPYVCTYCGKSFVESSNLKVHVRSHTKEKPHICVTCGRGFSRVFLLQIHTRTHTGERPYQCNLCDKAFSQRGDLKAHKKIHTDDRPYVCEQCGKRFIKNSSLNQHKKCHIKNEPDDLMALTETDIVANLNLCDDSLMLPMFENVYFGH